MGLNTYQRDDARVWYCHYQTLWCKRFCLSFLIEVISLSYLPAISYLEDEIIVNIDLLPHRTVKKEVSGTAPVLDAYLISEYRRAARNPQDCQLPLN